jgi:hypothetical protein
MDGSFLGGGGSAAMVGSPSFLTSVDGAEGTLVSYEPLGKALGVPASDNESPLLVWLVGALEIVSDEVAVGASGAFSFVLEDSVELTANVSAGAVFVLGSTVGAGTSPLLKRFDQSPEETGEVSGDVCAG